MINFPLQFLFFILGAAIGSFLNVCIVRMPRNTSVVFPSSHCPSCKKNIPWYDNIPLASYFLLKGKCRFCRTRIAFRYWLVEMTTAVFFVIFYRHCGLQFVLLPHLVFISGLIVATFVDLEYRIIPDQISLGGILAGLVLSVLIPGLHESSSHLLGLWRSFLGVLIGGGMIYLLAVAGDFVFKKETMGGGDIKLLGAIGAFLGWKLAVLTFFIAPFFGIILGIIEKIRTKESLIPYGPFLSLAAVVAVFYGDEIIAIILSGYGIHSLIK